MKNETQNIIDRYERRNALKNLDLYNPIKPDVLYAEQEKERKIARLLRDIALEPLQTKNVLEIGCGSGGNLLNLLRLGFEPENLTGNELLHERYLEACRRLPEAVNLIHGDANKIDLPTNHYDIVYQSTVFTSLLDDAFQKELAERMWRWVKPGGGVLWYDFIFDNPKNPDVRGVKVKRIQELFPESKIIIKRVTLAPPISRRVFKIHPNLYHIFNAIPFLRTHVLCWIGKSSRE